MSPEAIETTVTMSGVSDSILASFSEVGSQMLDTIGGLVPVVLPILGVSLVITFGIRKFKMFGNNV